jgi:cytochrome c-type biogenesis protein CcmH/NrfG
VTGVRGAWGAAVIAAMAVAFGAVAMAQADPTLAPGAFHPVDRRAHRYGEMDYAHLARYLAELRDQRSGAASSEDRAVLSVKLADVFVAREMLPEALGDLEEARRLAPDEPEILWRLAVVHHYLGHDADATEALVLAERRAPDDPQVLQAAARVRGE